MEWNQDHQKVEHQWDLQEIQDFPQNHLQEVLREMRVISKHLFWVQFTFIILLIKAGIFINRILLISLYLNRLFAVDIILLIKLNVK